MTLYTKDDFQSLFNVSRETFEKIETYDALLQKWNKAINLVSPKTLNESWHRHFIDSAQIVKVINPNAKIYADLGCGGGFPGLVIAMMRPELDVHLVESDERKGQFMRNVSRETSLQNVRIHTHRIEDMPEKCTPHVLSARALASLEGLLDYTYPWAQANPALEMLFMKGIKAEEEIAAARQKYDFTLDRTPSITDDNASILMLRDVRLKT